MNSIRTDYAEPRGGRVNEWKAFLEDLMSS